MTTYYTKVDGADYLSHGQLSRTKAIAEARAFAQYQRDKYAAICAHLEQSDDQLRVTVVQGSIIEKFVREVKP